MMKKISGMILSFILLFSLSTLVSANPSLSLEYINGQMNVDNSGGRHYNPSNNGFLLNLEYPVEPFIFNLVYTILDNPEDLDSGSGFTLYAADQSLIDIKLGYRLIDTEVFMLDTSLVYNKLNYDVKTNTYRHKVKNTFMELKGKGVIIEKLLTEFHVGIPLSSSTTDSNNATITDSDAHYYGLKFNYLFNQQWSGIVGYRVYKNEFTRESVIREYSQRGLTIGLGYQF